MNSATGKLYFLNKQYSRFIHISQLKLLSKNRITFTFDNTVYGVRIPILDPVL